MDIHTVLLRMSPQADNDEIIIVKLNSLYITIILVYYINVCLYLFPLKKKLSDVLYFLFPQTGE